MLVICVCVFSPWHIDVNYVWLRLNYFRTKSQDADVPWPYFLTGEYIYVKPLTEIYSLFFTFNNLSLKEGIRLLTYVYRT